MSVIENPLKIFHAQGIPHRRLEDWKYTDLRPVLDTETVKHAGPLEWTFRLPADVYEFDLDDDDLPEDIALGLHSLSKGDAMDAAARAFDGNVLVLTVDAGSQIAEPLNLNLVSSGHGLVVLSVYRGASLTLLETHDCHGDQLRNLSLSILLDEGAQLTHIRDAGFATDMVAVETISVVQDSNSRYVARFLNGGAKLSRTEVNIALNGEGAEADLSGVSVLADGAHADVTTRIDHAVPNTTSRQLFKKVAGGKSRAIYQGKITVREGAIGTDSRQTAKALLLSNQAEADLKPELEILADDVKCAHGAAVGDLDQDSLFYLRARGIPEAEARGMLVHAFLQEVIDGFPDDLRDAATRFVDRGLKAAMVNAT